MIPFHWKMQTVTYPENWCQCRRCRKALTNLIKHTALRATEPLTIADHVYAMSPHTGNDCKVCNGPDDEVK